MVLSPDSEFFRFFGNANGEAPPAPGATTPPAATTSSPDNAETGSTEPANATPPAAGAADAESVPAAAQ